MKFHITAIISLLALAGVIGACKCVASSQPSSAAGEQSRVQPAEVASALYVVEYNEATPLPVGKGKAVIVDFYATWCGPCRAYSPVFESVAKKYSTKARFYRIDVDKFPALAAQYNISSIPTTLFFRPDGTYSYNTGYIQADALTALVERAIAGKK